MAYWSDWKAAVGACGCLWLLGVRFTTRRDAARSLQLLEKREKEAPGGAAHARRDGLRYGSRLYRLLGAMLQAAHPIAANPSAPPPALDQLRRLALRMAWQAAASCLAVQQEWDARRAGEGSGQGRAEADDVGLVLRSKAEVRQRLQVRGLQGLWMGSC